MKVYAVVHKNYALSWASITGYNSHGQTFRMFRTLKAAKAWIAGMPYDHYAVVPFVSDEKDKHDARRRSEWKNVN